MGVRQPARERQRIMGSRLSLAAGAVFILILSTASTSGCSTGTGTATTPGSGTTATQRRTNTGFHAIALQGVADVRITRSPTTTVSVTTDNNLLSLVETTVDNGVLVIRTSPNLRSFNGVQVSVELPVLNRVEVSGSGGVTLVDVLSPALTISVSGSSTVTAGGTVDRLAVGIAGQGNAQLSSLSSGSATVKIRGAGNVDVTSSTTLAVDISGVGTVTYGGGATLEQQISGKGTVRRRG
jgi:hypothetical protein